MSAVPDDLFEGLKKDVDAHSAGQASPPPATTNDTMASQGGDLIDQLKADVERHWAGESQSTAAAPPKKAQVPLSSLPYEDKVARAESSGNPNAKAPDSTAVGLGQFINSTWVPLVRKHRPDLADRSDQELLGMRTDPALNREMVHAYAQDNAAKLNDAGIPVNDASLYGAHWFGPDTFQKIYNAKPDTPIEDLVGAGPAKNNGIAGQTAAQVRTIAANRMGLTVMPQNLSWGDTAEQAGENFLPSLGKTAAGVYDALRHPLDTASTLKQIGVGLDSKLEGYAGRPQDPQQKESDEALVDALGHSYKEKYGTIEGFKNAVANNPADVLFDASTVLGGAGLGAKLPGVVGKAASVAGAAGNAINPLTWPGNVLKMATAPARAFTAAGTATPKVEKLINKVTDGKMSSADLVDPEVKQAFANTIAKKGVSEASVREGILASLGLKTPTSVVTGAAPAVGARDATSAAVDANNDVLAARAAKVAPQPATSDIASALDQAHTASYNAASSAYDRIRNTPGTFGTKMPEMPQLGTKIRSAFSQAGIPGQDLGTLKQTGHTQAANAISLLGNTWGKGQTLTKGGQFNAQEILAMQKALSNFRQTATGSDIKATGVISDAFDKHIAGLSKRGLFVDPATGSPVTGLGDQIKAANQGYKAHFQNFEEPNGANNAIVSAIRKLKSGQGRAPNGALMPSQDTDLYTSAQSALGRDLLHPAKGGSTYNQIAKLLGGNTAPLDDYIKGTVLSGEKPVKNAAALMNDPNSAVSKAFASSPDDLSRARHIHAADAINNAKPSLDARAHSVLGNMTARLVGKGVASVLGEHALGTIGAVLGPTVVEPAFERIGESRAARAALKGAPEGSNLTRSAKWLGRKILGRPGITTAHYASEAKQPQNAVVARASGGKVDTGALVERLIERWKKAKRDTDKSTEPLLKIPDETIIKALDIAGRAI